MKRHLFICALLCLGTLGAGAEQNTVSCPQSVRDFADRTVCIPEKVERIVITCYGGASQEIALLMGGDKIVAQPGVGRFQAFVTVYPSMKDVPSVGSFSDVNIESLMKLHPSIVFAGVVSKKMNDRIEAAGFPTYTMGIGLHTIDSLLEEFIAVGKILHTERKAQALVTYWRDTLQLIDERLQAIPPERRKRVYYANGNGKKMHGWKRSWTDEFIESAGGINVAASMPLQGEVSSESLVVRNPDVIVSIRSGASKISAQTIRETAAFGQINAVRYHRVYEGPVGTFWWDRPSPEAILGIIWLAKILYPSEMADIDLERQTRYFFRTFYGHILSDKDYKDFFRYEKEQKSID